SSACAAGTRTRSPTAWSPPCSPTSSPPEPFGDGDRTRKSGLRAAQHAVQRRPLAPAPGGSARDAAAGPAGAGACPDPGPRGPGGHRVLPADVPDRVLAAPGQRRAATGVGSCDQQAAENGQVLQE